MRTGPLRLAAHAASAALLAGCASLGSAQGVEDGISERPQVLLIATGGTISNTDDDGRWTGEDIVEAVPGLDEIAHVKVEQFSNIASGSFTPAMWIRLARRVQSAFATDDVAGVVITHGTDTMEETAYFLDLVIGDERPVLVTGAMRNNSRLSSDGAANLYNAVRLAADPEARGRGALVVMNDVALPAREATKMNTSRVEAFAAPARGPVAILDPDSVVFMDPAPGVRPSPLIDVHAVDSLPRVDIVFSYVGADGALVDAAVAAGARGVVMAGVGRGGTTPGQRAAMDRAVEAGVYVVTSNRTMSGRVPVGSDERRLEDWEPGRGLRFGAEALTPQKARVLLMLALAATDEPERVLDIFRTY